MIQSLRKQELQPVQSYPRPEKSQKPGGHLLPVPDRTHGLGLGNQEMPSM